jgi:hypothetical protein
MIKGYVKALTPNVGEFKRLWETLVSNFNALKARLLN